MNFLSTERRSVLCCYLIAAVCILVGYAHADDDSGLVYSVTAQDETVEIRGKIFVTAKLTNKGDEPVVVYWGDYAYDEMYQFDFENKATKGKLVCRRGLMNENPPMPKAVESRHFRTINPSGSLQYRISLGSAYGANAQRVFFTETGDYIVRPKLHISTRHSVNPATGQLVLRDDAWTGMLESEPFEIKVAKSNLDLVLPPLQIPGGKRMQPPTLDDENPIQIRGVVVDHNGKPVVDATVQLNHSVPSFGSYMGLVHRPADHAFVDNQGRFLFRNVPGDAATYEVIANSPVHAVKSVVIDGDAENIGEIQVMLDDTVDVCGRVVSSEGDALPNVRVNSRMITDHEGRFCFKASAETKEHTINAWRSGYQNSSDTVDKATAISGDWTIVLHREESLAVIGRARASNGIPIAGAQITFHLEPLEPEKARNVYSQQIRAKTDSRGNFRVVLPEAANYLALAIVENKQPGNQDVRMLKVAKMSPGENLGFMVFNNRGKLEIELQNADQIPKRYKRSIVVRPVLPNNDSLISGSGSVPFDGSACEVNGLSPGTYRVDLYYEDLHRLHLSQLATIPEAESRTDPSVGKVKFVAPEMQFGDLRGKVLMPDGKTPAQLVSFYVMTEGFTLTAETDDKGVLTVKDFPAGDVVLSAISPIISRKNFVGHKVVANKNTDFGTIQLRRTEDDFGFVSGTLKYDDGKLVRFHQSGVYFDNPLGLGLAMLPLVSIGSNRGKFVADSAFEIQAEAGKRKIVFRLGARNMYGYAGGLHSQVVANVNIEAGKTIRQDLVLRRRIGAAKLDVSWAKSLSSVTLDLSVHQGNLTYRAMQQTDNSKTQQSIYRIPAGECVVIFRAEKYFSCKTIQEGAEPFQLHFDGASGSILVETTNADGKPISGLGISVRLLAEPNDVHAIIIPPASKSVYVQNQRNNKMFSSSNGQMIVSGLAPGKYAVKIQGTDWVQEKNVVVVDSKQTRIDIQRR